MSAHITEKDQTWLLPDRTKNKIASGLYIIATPIGNLGDITLRALDALSVADLVVCEDTRVSGKLLSHYGIKKSMLAYNDHNADKQRGLVLERLSKGEIIALISDAGTPLVSDPGFKLVRDCLDLGLYVTALPGANAPLSALQLSGLPSDKFCFLGFLPVKQGARVKALEEWQNVGTSLIVFETAPRLLKTLETVRDILGDRDVAVVRELTKLYEEVRRGEVSELLRFYTEAGAPKGEIVLVIAPGEQRTPDEREIMHALKNALQTMNTKEAAAHVAEITGYSRKFLYEKALKIKRTW